ncbi:MAG: prepilin peptidase [Clostridia bacterium]|nr:prepilin peptidase [Clostridia bacterium]
MDIFYYIMIFIMGTVFGSFFTLAVYRIPLKKDITHERSFCPNCNHKLGFWDMIPILSYIFAKGKCRYCGEKIRIRYLILEALSGIVFLTQYLALNMHFPYLEISKIAFFIAFVFMYITIAIISGIDKEYRKIHIGLILFGFIMQGLYILYLYIMERTSMYRYGMYLCMMLLLCIVDIVSIKKLGESKYPIQCLMLCSYIGACLGSELLLLIVLLSLILIFLNFIYAKIKNQINDKPDILQNNEIPKVRIGFFLGITTITVTIIETFITYM